MYNPFKCDIWSSGILVYLILIGDYPFGDDSCKELIHNITTA